MWRSVFGGSRIVERDQQITGLRAEDVIVRLGDETIANTGELSKFLVAHLPGETVRVVFYRGDDERTVQLTLGTRPKE